MSIECKGIDGVKNEVEKLTNMREALAELKSFEGDVITRKQLNNLNVSSYLVRNLQASYQKFWVETTLYSDSHISKSAINNGSYKIILKNGSTTTLTFENVEKFCDEVWNGYKIKKQCQVKVQGSRCYYLVKDVINLLNKLCNECVNSLEWEVFRVGRVQEVLNSLLQDFTRLGLYKETEKITTEEVDEEDDEDKDEEDW